MTAQIGNEIFFERERDFYEGIVVKTYTNSVMVEVGESDMAKLNLPNNRTVVNHKHYKVKL